MRAECVRLDHSAPVGIECCGSLTDAVAPVVVVGKAAARPADVRHLKRLERGDHVIANAARVRDRGIWTDPYAIVDAVPEMLSKLAKNVAINLRAGFRHVN